MKDYFRFSGDSGAHRWRVWGLLLIAAPAWIGLLVSDAAAGPKPKAAALAGHEVAFASSGDPSQALTKTARAECPLGKGVVSGGFSFSTNAVEAYSLISNHPSGTFIVQEPGGDPIFINNGWLVTVRRTDGIAQNWGLQAYAVCVDTE